MVADPRIHARKQRQDEERGRKAVETFRCSHRGFRKIFAGHFGDENPAVEVVSYHLAQVEASMPSVREALRLARYPKAGNRNPKRFALGLMENIAALEAHLRRAEEALEALASGKRIEASAEEE